MHLTPEPPENQKEAPNLLKVIDELMEEGEASRSESHTNQPRPSEVLLKQKIKCTIEEYCKAFGIDDYKQILRDGNGMQSHPQSVRKELLSKAVSKPELIVSTRSNVHRRFMGDYDSSTPRQPAPIQVKRLERTVLPPPF